MVSASVLKSIGLLLLGVFIILLTTRKVSAIEEVFIIIAIVVGIKLIIESLSQLGLMR